jgi:molybdopterin-guanine dinucleotide biosynthesis protein A
MSAEVLAVLSGWPGVSSAVPLVGGRPQPLCARWSAADLVVAAELVAAGERSMKALLARAAAEMLGDVAWPGDPGVVFADVDRPEDLFRFGLAPSRPRRRQGTERTR